MLGRTFVYGYNFKQEGSEVFINFPRIPEIVTSVPASVWPKMSTAAVQAFAEDAMITALQARIGAREAIPESDSLSLTRADGFAMPTVTQAMKLMFFEARREKYKSVADLVRQVGEPETAVRRILDLRHNSRVSEIQEALAIFGFRLAPTFDVRPKILPNRADVSNKPVVA